MGKTKVRVRKNSIEVSGSGANALFAAFSAGATNDPDELRRRLNEIGDADTPIARAERRAFQARLEQLTSADR